MSLVTITVVAGVECELRELFYVLYMCGKDNNYTTFVENPGVGVDSKTLAIMSAAVRDTGMYLLC